MQAATGAEFLNESMFERSTSAKTETNTKALTTPLWGLERVLGVTPARNCFKTLQSAQVLSILSYTGHQNPIGMYVCGAMYQCSSPTARTSQEAGSINNILLRPLPSSDSCPCLPKSHPSATESHSWHCSDCPCMGRVTLFESWPEGTVFLLNQQNIISS